MSATEDAVDTIITLTAAGVTLVVDLRDGLPPAVPYWGAELPGLDATTVTGLVVAARGPAGRNDVDEPARVGVLPEGGTGFPGRPGLEGSREGRAWSPRLRTVAITLDGADVTNGPVVLHGSGALEVALRDHDSGLGATMTLELEPSGLVRARAVVTNLDASPYDLQSLTLALPVPAEAGELLDLAGRWSRERVPQRRDFTVGTHLRESRRGRTGADAATVLHACAPGTGFARGETYAVHTAWSGNHVHYAERTFAGTHLIGGGELLLPGEVRLEQGASYASPWLYFCHGDGLDEVAARFHAHVRARRRPVGPDRPVTLNVWEAVYFDHDLDRLLALAQAAAELGVERFVLDDGWFGARRHERAGLGDWVVSPEAWPDGLHPLVDRVRELGMEFGLWFEPEMVNLDSDVARAHPDWVMGARGDALPPPARHQHVLDLGVPEAYAHVRDQVLAVLAEYDVGYVKWDHNRDLVEGGDLTRGGRPAVHAQTLAFYRLLEEVREAHPTLEIESCASGGGRVDLEVLERTDRVWASDCIDPLERQQIDRWTTQLLPPEVIGSHIASGRSHTTGRTHDLGFRAATALFGHLGIEWDLAEASPDELAELRAWVGLYTSWRRLLLTGQVVRLDTAEPHALVRGVVAEDASEAVFAAVSTGALHASPGSRTRLRGLDPAATYRVRHVQIGHGPSGVYPPPWWEQQAGVLMTGASLHRAGVSAPVVDPDQAVLYHLERV